MNNIFSNYGEKSYTKYIKLNLDIDRRIRTWIELPIEERDLWNKLAYSIFIDTMQWYEENVDSEDDQEEDALNVMSMIVKLKPKE